MTPIWTPYTELWSSWVDTEVQAGRYLSAMGEFVEALGAATEVMSKAFAEVGASLERWATVWGQ